MPRHPLLTCAILKTETGFGKSPNDRVSQGLLFNELKRKMPFHKGLSSGEQNGRGKGSISSNKESSSISRNNVKPSNPTDSNCFSEKVVSSMQPNTEKKGNFPAAENPSSRRLIDTEPNEECLANVMPTMPKEKDCSNISKETLEIKQKTPFKSIKKPSIENNPEDILQAWIALEVLSPQSFLRPVDLVGGVKSRIAQLSENLPWHQREKVPKYKKLYYELFLGSVDLGSTIKSLLEVYSDSRPDKPSMKGYCPIATVMLDCNGYLVDHESAISLSSFAWGAPLAFDGKLNDLGKWFECERSFKSDLENAIGKKSSRTNKTPLTYQHISEVYEFLVDKLNLNEFRTLPPSFVLRKYENEDQETSPKASLLNSFFLDDLMEARELAQQGKLPVALNHYLANKNSQKIDLLKDISGLQKLLEPKNAPLASWPGKGRFPLAMLQQAAVNAASADQMETGILAVNGPPGTGKTTLLRDVIAAKYTERAEIMASYDLPSDAFSKVSNEFKRNGANVSLYEIDERLKGYEMLISSSNNKAVENISSALPSMSEIATDSEDLRLFQTISDNVLDGKSWGVFAAVLGNASNRYHFAKTFWHDLESGLQTYLNHASGIPQIVTIPQDKGAPLKRNRKIVDSENPPISQKEALMRWRESRAHFLKTLELSKKNQKMLQDIHCKLLKSQRLSSEINAIYSKKSNITADSISAFEHFLSKLVPPKVKSIIDLFRPTTWILKKREAMKEEIDLYIGQMTDELGISIPDEDFFADSHENIQLSSLWCNESISKCRHDVFEAAVKLHKAFIDAAADPIRQNLSIFFESYGTRCPDISKHNSLVADLWSTFFLVVPAVSTTFSSINRMLPNLPNESLGWLLVDEAGQATPQAVVGAMMRTKQSIIVGDPIQIEPVVSLPDSLTKQICLFYGINPISFNAPEASVQTVADQASMYCSKFPTRMGFRDIGLPLLAHRRCGSPMFEISNEIAYSNLMVQGKKTSSQATILGPSTWIHVDGTPGPDKWCADEARVLINQLALLKQNGERPDFYVVTPFLVVQNNLRLFLLESGILKNWFDDPESWVRKHVGTVHTVQGREADIVFFILGAQGKTQEGARIWAGKKPNIINVAITRSKSSLYVIGNRDLWKNEGFLSVLDSYLPN